MVSGKAPEDKWKNKFQNILGMCSSNTVLLRRPKINAMFPVRFKLQKTFINVFASFKVNLKKNNPESVIFTLYKENSDSVK